MATKAEKEWCYCPFCSGSLDTGRECNDCGSDLMPYAYPWWQRLRDKLRKLLS
jgi:hypothetical protein